MDTTKLRQTLSLLRNDPDQLIEIILYQAQVIEDLEKRLAASEQRATALEKRLEELERVSHRQAGPFRRRDDEKVQNPKKPGNRKGHPGKYRAVPTQIDEVIEVPLDRCPKCNGSLSDQRCVEQIIEEIPEHRPTAYRLRTYKAICAACGEVRSTHPLQVSTAIGAAGVHLGPRALATAIELNKANGITLRKTSHILKKLFGLSITAGGIVQALHRVAGKLEGEYNGLTSSLRAAPVVHCDETGWWVGGPKSWLWVCTNVDSTVYHVANGRGRQVIFDILGTDFPGVLVSDCLVVYDDASPHQHKCYAHHLKAIHQACEGHPDKGLGYLTELRNMLLVAMAVKNMHSQLNGDIYAESCRRLETWAEELLVLPRGQPEEESVRRRMFKQRDHLFTFLYHPEVEATNNLAERQLRPAVIARKVSCGNRTPRGAHTWEVLTSIAATCAQRSISFLDHVDLVARLTTHPAENHF